jgi:radical SAM protein
MRDEARSARSGPETARVGAPPAIDLDRVPFTVFWETTRACDLRCVHCRASAQPRRDRRELDTREAFQLVDQVAELGSPVFVVTGGDPLKRDDLFEVLSYAVRRGVAPAVTPSGTPLLDERAIGRMAEVGVRRVALSLDGPDFRTHDGFRRQPGSFSYTLAALRHARCSGLATQVNTTVTRHNVERLGEIAALAAEAGATTWSAFFLVRVGRGAEVEQLDAETYERVFAFLHDLSKRAPFRVRTTAAPHYRRFVLQRTVAERRRERNERANVVSVAAETGHDDARIGRVLPPAAYAPRGVTDGRGIAFVSHTGNVYPSGFLPLVAGNVCEQTLGDIYRDSALFRLLRDSDRLGGKCGACEFRHICGGSRARAYSASGDPMAEDPCCAYEPARELLRPRASGKLSPRCLAALAEAAPVGNLLGSSD